MHIGLLLAQLAVGGTERQFSSLAEGLRARGHRVRFFPLFGGGALEGELLERAGIRAEPLRSPRPSHASLALPALAGTLARRLAADPPDVLYAGDYASNWIAASAAPRLSATIVWGIRNLGDDVGWRLWFLRRLGRSLRDRVGLLISNTESGLARHRALGYTPERTLVVPNGVDLGRFRPAEPGEREAFRRGLGLDEDTPLVGIVARFTRSKDHGTFLAAAELVARRAPRARFLIVAPSTREVPPIVSARIAAAGLKERVRILEGGSDPAAIERALDVLVSSSSDEGFPNAILEAMASGVPCAVTDAGDSAILVGDTGLVVPIRAPAPLAEAVLALLAPGAEERRARGVRARLRAEGEFGASRALERTEAALASAVDDGRPS